MRKELLLGSGGRIEKSITFDAIPPVFQNVVTLDMLEACNPDVVHDLNNLPYPFADGEFDEIHAYEVLEHCGRQGDWKFFFDQFAEFHRILKPGGYFCASVPMWDNQWAWADPGHCRIIAKNTLMFLEQEFYEGVGKDARSDYRPFYKVDFKVMAMQERDANFFFVLQKK